MAVVLDIKGLSKSFPDGTKALDAVDLAIEEGEIFALLGPNGAGKTTLIGAVCGTVRPTGGTISAFGYDMTKDWRRARARIGLVPQELNVDMFEHVERSVTYSRALFGKPADPKRIEDILKSLSLWDKRKQRIQALSGGMKRRVLIAKALAHDPDLLFLDEPTAGVDVELRHDMWELIGGLRTRGVTIVLTTHYIEEAQEMADRIGVIDRGKLSLVEEKAALLARLGRAEAQIRLVTPLRAIPAALGPFPLTLADGGRILCYRSEGSDRIGHGLAELVKAMGAADIAFDGLDVKQSSLEDIFVDLIHGGRREQGQRA